MNGSLSFGLRFDREHELEAAQLLLDKGNMGHLLWQRVI